MMAVTYRPMNSETLALKRVLISAGVNAWIIAIPTPAAMALTINADAESTNSRDSVAKPITSSDSTMLRCSPMRLPRPMPKNIARPMAMTGSMVSSAALLKLNGTSPRIDDNSGPTAAIDGRRLRATSTTLIISQTAVAGVARTFSMGGP